MSSTARHAASWDGRGPLVTVADFERHWATREETYELVDGHPIMSPPESFANLDAAFELGTILRSSFDREAWMVLLQAGLTVRGVDPATVRVPDLVVAARRGQEGIRLPAEDVVLVVEVLSPSTSQTDRLVKRGEYARAGIPAYLIVDRHPGPPALTLLTDPRDGDYQAEVTGASVTLRLAGRDIPLRVQDFML